MPPAKRTYPRRNYNPANPPPPAAPKAPRFTIQGHAAAWTTVQKITDTQDGWVKSTRAMTMAGGVLISTCTTKKNGAISSEALCFVPGAKIEDAGEGPRIR